MSSEKLENSTSEVVEENTDSNILSTTDKDVFEKVLSAKSSNKIEIGQGDAVAFTAKSEEATNSGLKVDQPKNEIYNIQLGLDDDENSDENLELKWDDDEIEDDLISLHPPPSLLEGEIDKEVLETTDPDTVKAAESMALEDKDTIIKSDAQTKDNESEEAEIDIICTEILDHIKGTDTAVTTSQMADNDVTAKDHDKELEDEVDSLLDKVDEVDEIDDEILNEDELLADSTRIDDNITEDLEFNSKDMLKTQEEGDKNDIAMSEFTTEVSEKDNKVTKTSQNESVSSIDANAEHGLKKPDMMLEIPTQEIIELMDDTDISCNLNQTNIDANDTITDVESKMSVSEDSLILQEDNKQSNKDSLDNIIKEDVSSIDIVSQNRDLQSTDSVKDVLQNSKILPSSNKDITETSIDSNVHNQPQDMEIDATSKEFIQTIESNKVEKALAGEKNITTELVAQKTVDVDPSTSKEASHNQEILNQEPTIDSETIDNETLIVKGTDTKTTKDSKQDLLYADTEVQISELKEVEPQPSTSKSHQLQEETKQLAPDSTDEMPEVTDSLGLLAESSRVMDDDEEQEDEEDDDDDFDQDESSNQMTAEHSEDSNAPHSETDMPKEGKETTLDSPQDEKGEEKFDYDISNVVSELEKDGDVTEKDGDMDIEEILCDELEVTPEQIGDEPAPTEDITTVKDTPDMLEDTEAGKDETVKPVDAVQPMEIETVKLSDTSDNEGETEGKIHLLQSKLTSSETDTTQKKETPKSSPSKKKLTRSQPTNILNIVDLEESSSEDDIQEVIKEVKIDDQVSSIDVDTCSKEHMMAVDVATQNTVAKLDPKEITIKPATSTEPTLVIPEITPQEKPKPKFSLEIFNLDSDEEESPKPAEPAIEEPKITPAIESEKPKETNRCINISCSHESKVYIPADSATVAYYDATRKRRAMVCERCSDIVAKRTQSLLNGIKYMTPLLDLDIIKQSSELVEISDSESEDEAEATEDPKEAIGEKGAAFVEEQLAKMINETWLKFKMDSRLADAEDALTKEMEKLEKDSQEIDTLLNECQIATDKLRNELYATFEQGRHELSPIAICDTPNNKYICLESLVPSNTADNSTEGRLKRRLSSATEMSAKRPAIPLGYASLDAESTSTTQETKPGTIAQTPDASKFDDDKDISVLKVSAESAPSDLPPPGDLLRPPIRPGMAVYAMRSVFKSWLRARVGEVSGKAMPSHVGNQTFTVCRIKFDFKVKNQVKTLTGRNLAYIDPPEVRMTIGTRVIALYKDSAKVHKKNSFYLGIVAEVPNPVNNYRYLVFFDDGYAQYVRHSDTRLVCECSQLVWEEVHPFSREFVREYLMAYPERPMVRLHAGQSLKTEWNGKWWSSRVRQVDASLVQVYFEEDNHTEWIYRGSTRLAPLYLELQAAEKHRARAMPRTKAQPRSNMPYVEYTRSDEQSKSEEPPPSAPPPPEQPQQPEQRESRQRAVAKKSTVQLPQPQSSPVNTIENVTSRVVYYTPKNAVKPYKMSPHSCGAHCKRTDVLALQDLRTYNPLAKPLLSGWERQIVRFKGHKEVMYRAPCGRRLRSMKELHRYLRVIHSDMAVDLFDFTVNTHCLAEFVLNKCLVGKKDLSHGKENVPVPCVNYYDDSLPEFCSYNTERSPTAGVPLNLDPEFLCGCDCTDDCVDKSKCACWKMTQEGARTIGMDANRVGYVYKRLPDPLPTGIYECNSRCKCKQTCLNRVAQHPLQLKLQVFKTLNRGWGIRALNDVPKGSFLCVYAGNLLTDATANMDGLNEGDEYLAELDYIEVVEQMKEGFEEDIPEADKKLDKKNLVHPPENDEDLSSSDEDEKSYKNEEEDDDFRPGHIGMGVAEFNKRLRKRDKKEKEMEKETKAKEKEGETKTEEDCITISDDEEVREPARFMAQAGMESNQFISKYRSVRSHFGEDEACYIMDAKVQGNIGRYLNHSCAPNVFVQNVFVDTHDPRFPWVAFFALSHIKAGTELTWNYNYDVGSVPGKVLYCYCGAPTCRGRLL